MFQTLALDLLAMPLAAVGAAIFATFATRFI